VRVRTAFAILLFALSFLCLAGNTGRSYRPSDGGSTAVADTIAPAAPPVAPIDTDAVRRAQMDSTFLAEGAITVDTIDLAPALAHDADTAKKKDGLEDPVEYEAADSMVYDATSKKAYLYGKANVKYQDMTLDAGHMAMDFDSSLVKAVGITDTAGKAEQTPVFHQKNDEYESEDVKFNFKTKKGYISNVKTKQGNGFLDAQHSKRDSSGIYYLEKAKYTTCDAKHPHFYLRLSRAKVVPNKETVFGPAYLVVEDVPLPIGIPYGFFPFSKKYSSGIVMPTYGDETTRGFYLRDGGYYFALSDYMDLKLLGEIYTKGSWGVSAETNYKRRYKYSGNFYVSYITTVEGEKNMPDYSKTKSLKVQWTHTKDASAGGNTTFSARVNFASENYERSNLASIYNPLSYTQSTRASSVSFSHNFPNLGATLSGSVNLTQNLRDSTIAMTLPDINFSLNRRYPFRRKHQSGKERWYEKISFSYTGQMSNSISTQEDKLLHSNLIKDWKNGIQHRIPVDATFQLFKYINITPSFSFRDLMYFTKINRSWDDERLCEVADTAHGFYNLYDWNIGISANTTLYGFYKPWKKLFGDKIIAIRHVFKPTISFSYAPDFTAERYGYVKTYDKTDAYGNVSTVTYSPYSNGVYGYPSGTKSGSITMSVSNNLEMKVKSDRDSTGERKISLIDELSASMSYNLAAQTRPWSNLSTRLRLKLTKSYTFSLNAVFATYAYAFNESGKVITSDRTEWSYGRFGRFQGMSQNLSYTFDNNTLNKLRELFGGRSRRDEQTDYKPEDDETDIDEANLDPNLNEGRKKATKKKGESPRRPRRLHGLQHSVVAHALVWRHHVRRPQQTHQREAHALSLRLHPNAQRQRLRAHQRRLEHQFLPPATTSRTSRSRLTTASLSRDLHCFDMSASVVLHPYTSFNFTFRARANELTDALKWDKRSSYSSNIEWY